MSRFSIQHFVLSITNHPKISKWFFYFFSFHSSAGLVTYLFLLRTKGTDCAAQTQTVNSGHFAFLQSVLIPCFKGDLLCLRPLTLRKVSLICTFVYLVNHSFLKLEYYLLYPRPSAKHWVQTWNKTWSLLSSDSHPTWPQQTLEVTIRVARAVTEVCVEASGNRRECSNFEEKVASEPGFAEWAGVRQTDKARRSGAERKRHTERHIGSRSHTLHWGSRAHRQNSPRFKALHHKQAKCKPNCM